MEIPKAYEPQLVEDKWYQFWVENSLFTADPARVGEKRPAFSIVIPPPNVTGMLHMGHVLNNTIQDILARKARMDGKEVLWLPGTDHAGIATQVQVEKALKKEERLTKQDLGREKFLERVWQWKEKHGGIIIQQLKKLGCACDWTRERFTMDPEYSRCVQRVFVDLYKKGLIYRGKRMVNWCPATQTALSDEEVEMKPQKGFMYHFKVQVVEEPNTWLTIATTRPETIPADTAVAVNPKDPRYTQLIGKHVYRALPLDVPKEQRVIPIIADEHVDFEFGTGVLKVTPAHDKADFEIGLRHKLPVIDVLTPDAKMTAAAGAELVGLDRFVARKKAAEILEAAGAIDKIEPYENNVGFSQRADVPIEPRLSEQWFLKYPAVAQSQACVADGRMKFHPDRWAKVYDHWLANIQDWCISRQLWWGHRIPVWNRANPGPYESRKNSYENLDGNYTVETICQIDKPDGEGWVQDPDVLDTWFSSWLWPFATMGWPERTDTLKKFYPTSDLVTGPDIIFFWVARMIMAGYEYMGDLPFLNVYFTGIVRDKNGDKMSKSLGNSPDPIPLMERYGADAIRFGILRSTPLGADAVFEDREFDRHPKDKRYDFAKIEWKTDRFPQLELARNLCNKLWNACRFRQMQGGVVQGEINSSLLTNDDKWILLKLDQAIKEITTALNDYKFNEAAQALYRFFWSEYCDWYVEASKAVFFGKNEAQKANTLAVIDFVLSHTLRLFHPFLPFITEELWHGMGYATDMPEGQGGKTIMNAPWPKPFEGEIRDHYSLDECYLQFAQDKYDLVTEGRNLRRIGNIQAAKKVKFVLKPAGEVIPHDVEVIKILLNAEALEIVPDYQPKKGTPTAHTKMGELFLPLEGLVDVAAEKARLTKEKEKIEAEIVKVEQKLSNPAFTQKVPANVLQEHQQRLVDWQNKLAHVKAALEALG